MEILFSYYIITVVNSSIIMKNCFIIYIISFFSPALLICGDTIDSLRYDKEKHFANIRQLTFGGDNAEAYWSFDGKELIFQSNWDKLTKQGCDQIFRMKADGTPYQNGKKYELVSTDKGRTTCSYFLNDGRIIFGSTHEAGGSCPEATMFAEGRYVWNIYDSYDIYVTDKNGENPEKLIASSKYDAEATVSPDGKYIVFTSNRSGDLELWRYDVSTGALKQLTNTLGYDGGAFFSPDGKKIVWRASRPVKDQDVKNYKELQEKGLVEPKELQLFIADIDGNNVEQITQLPGANWAPFFHPSGQKILFCSNHHSQQKGGREFAIFMIDIRSKNVEQITHSGTFDAFPMFSPDGKKIVWCSNRNKERTPTRSTNVFVADWVE